MKMSRFKQMLVDSYLNKERMESRIQEFYASADMDSGKGVSKLIQIARPLLEQKGIIVIELPFADRKMASLYYKGTSNGYILLNTSVPKIQLSFSLCREIYRILYEKKEEKCRVWLLKDHYYEYEEEFEANLFTQMLLMPESSYKMMFQKFRKENEGRENNLSVLVKLMCYFEVPYMAALIRCYELNLLDSGMVLEELIQMDEENIRKEWKRLWLDESLLNPTKKDDYENLEELVKLVGNQYRNDYADERTINRSLQNIKHLYEKIKGE